MMKKKIVTLLLIIFTIPLSYIFYVYFIAKDEYESYRSLIPIESLEKAGNEIILPVNIVDFDDNYCLITYCYFEDCNNSLKMSCNKLISGNYLGSGEYVLKLKFRTYFPSIFKKQYFVGWSIEKSEEKKEDFDKERYLSGVIKLLSNNYVWESYSILVSNPEDSPNDWFKNSDATISNEYLKSVFLLNLIAKKYNLQEIDSIVKREIEYLNTNSNKILSKGSTNPEAYVFLLKEFGLRNEYLGIIEDFEVPEYELVKLEKNISTEHIHSLNSDNIRHYNSIVQYMDYANIFKKYNLENLSNYYYSLAIKEYNEHFFGSFQGLCSIGYSDINNADSEYVLEELKETRLNGNEYFFNLNLEELLVCRDFLTSRNDEVVEINPIIEEILDRGTIKVGESSYYTVGIKIDDIKDIISIKILRQYQIMDNLMYILSE